MNVVSAQKMPESRLELLRYLVWAGVVSSLSASFMPVVSHYGQLTPSIFG